jgi:hypothetical protein
MDEIDDTNAIDQSASNMIIPIFHLIIINLGSKEVPKLITPHIHLISAILCSK